MQDRELIHAVPMRARFLCVGDQHGVVDRSGFGGAGAAHHRDVELGIVVDFQHARIGQQRRQRRDHRIGGELAGQGGTLGILVAQRHVAGATGRGRDREAEQGRALRIDAVGLGVDRDHAGFARLGDPVGECRQLQHRGIGAEGQRRILGLRPIWCHRQRRRLRGCRRHGTIQTEAREDAAKTLRVQEVGEPLGVRLARGEVFQRQRQRRVVAQQHQRARQACRLGVRDQRVAALGGLHRRRRRQHAFEVAELGHQRAGGLRPDAGHAGDVVDRIAHQSLHFDHALRRHAEALHHLGVADRAILDRVEHRNAGADQLHQVLVGGDDGRPAALGAGGARVGGDQIVRLPVGQLDGGDVERLGRLPHQRELRHDLGRRLRPLRLVGVEQPVAEGGAPGVEDHRDVGADMLAQQLGQHVGEAEHGIDRHAVGAVHRRQRVKGAEDEPRAVDQDQMQARIGLRGVSARRRLGRRHRARTGGSNRGTSPRDPR